MPAVVGPPAKPDDDTRDRPARHANWLELFFDLVMVVFVGQLALGLHGAPTLAAFLTFGVLFFPAWWAWVNVTLTLNLFGERVTGKIWLMMSVVMLAVGMMAAAIVDGLSERAWAYALGNAVIRVVLFFMWWLQGRRNGVAWYRPVVYSGVTAVLWAASAFAPHAAQLVLWGIAIAIEVLLLAFLGRDSGWLRRALNIDHLGERVGLFVVIVFGESVLSVIEHLSEHWTAESGLAALMSFLVITLLAWAFFSYGTPSAEKGWRRLHAAGDIGGLRDTVMYLPFVLVTAVVLIAAGLGTAVAEPADPLPTGATVAITGGLSLFYFTNALEMLRYREPVRNVLRWAVVGVVLPFVLLAFSAALDAVYLVLGAAAFVGIMVAIAELNRRRQRAASVTVSGEVQA